MFYLCYIMSSSNEETNVFIRLQQILEDILTSNRRVTQKINKLTKKISNIHKTQAELRAAIKVLYARYEAHKDIKD
ncbi:hypothetical protein HanIR_Chr05g0253721 [Helianthus annuus]|nr:hypothetical protein HanIR_Chr05g0253721 [Helianthus annuus]